MSSPGAEEELTQLRVQVSRLQEQLGEERLLRRQAEEAVEAVAADRNRLQRARDELATALLMAERRAQEAEEEQIRAESAAAALAAQLAEAQRDAASSAAASTQQPAGGPGAPRDRALRTASEAEGSDAAVLARDAEILLAELDRERKRSEELVRTLDAAEREAVSATEKLIKAQQRIKQLEAKFKGKDVGSSGLKDAPSSASLEGLLAGGGGEAGAAAVLQQRIAALKASRDKLIGAFDAQAAEVERLSTDNAALSESLSRLRDAAAKWEAQAQDSLAQNERLKDLLEESATWNVPTSTTGSAAGGAGASEGSGGGEAAAAAGDGGALAELCQRIERELLMEKAKTAQLDLHVRALCMELTRVAQTSSQMQAALVPVLGGIEARLVQVLGMRPRPGALGSAAA